MMSADIAMESVEIQEPEVKDTWSECVLNGLNEMRQNNTLCDVILNSADNKLYCVHSAVLGAGSRFFRQVLSQSKTSGGGIVVRLEKSGSLVAKMVDFLYTGRTAASVEELEELRQMAEGYGLDRLSSLCTERLYGVTVTVVPNAEEEGEDADAGLHTLVESISYSEGGPVHHIHGDNVIIDSENTTDLQPVPQVQNPTFTQSLGRGGRRPATTSIRRPGTLGKKTWRDYRYRCNTCSKEFASLSRLRGHEATHSGEKRHECSICGARFIQIEYLREHISMHSNLRPFKCELCHATFRLMRHLKKHMKVHSSERPYACDQCGKTFKRPDRLRQHARVHSGERPYSCPHCDKSFKVMEALVRHKRALHYEDCPFRCGFCGTGFKRMKGLEDHLRVCDTAISRRSLQCDICLSYFKTKMTLIRHKRKHMENDDDAEKENSDTGKKGNQSIIKQESVEPENELGDPVVARVPPVINLTDPNEQDLESAEMEESAIQMLMQSATEHNTVEDEQAEAVDGNADMIQVLHVEFVSEHAGEEGGAVVEEVTAEQMAAELHDTVPEDGEVVVTPEVQFVHEAIEGQDHAEYVMDGEAVQTEDGQVHYIMPVSQSQQL